MIRHQTILKNSLFVGLWSAAALTAAAWMAGCGDESSTPVIIPTDSGPQNDSGVDSGDAGTDASDSGVPAETVATPVFAPPPGTFDATATVAITTTTPGAMIHYTLDGTTPNASSPIYTSPLTVVKTATLKAMATAEGFQDSDVHSGEYIIKVTPGTVEDVHFEPKSGRFYNDTAVTLTSGTEGATICYGSEPSQATCTEAGTCWPGSNTYTAPIPLTETQTSIYAVACKAGMTASNRLHENYILAADNPTFDPPADRYDPEHPVAVTISTRTKGGVIRYTTDGSEATCDKGPTFLERGTLPTPFGERDTVLKAIVCKEHYLSGRSAAEYPGKTCVGYFSIHSYEELQQLSRCEAIDGHLYYHGADGDNVTDLSPLSKLTRISGYLTLSSSNTLKSLRGLEHLTSVGGNLTLQIQLALTDLHGLEHLTSVGGNLTIGYNSKLQQLGALSALTTIGGDLQINGHETLTDITGLSKVSKLGGKFTVTSNKILPECQPKNLLKKLQDGGYTGTFDVHDNHGTGTCDSMPAAARKTP
ncbi:chitobiase/beta-hexosaminidase C-terminal domain-containing protein [Pendulispora brunnea]|uniref:Chitobiase/beta-hexosaminidase C-terminal domain-containing protein n=1 Tax=Pendulispora brunnea TaxID=2905690 RepID=A0ABZ2KAP3_9BACT